MAGMPVQTAVSHPFFVSLPLTFGHPSTLNVESLHVGFLHREIPRISDHACRNFSGTVIRNADAFSRHRHVLRSINGGRPASTASTPPHPRFPPTTTSVEFVSGSGCDRPIRLVLPCAGVLSICKPPPPPELRLA
ncbi:hypothetical protein C8R47DRAFT_1209856 [Mycena vitilis]|nr:hypothetical protein C8R47DRAFT_1209856 [Mycena vitilis]